MRLFRRLPKENQNIFYYPYIEGKLNTLGYELDDIYYDIQGAYGYNGALTNCDDIFFKDMP